MFLANFISCYIKIIYIKIAYIVNLFSSSVKENSANYGDFPARIFSDDDEDDVGRKPGGPKPPAPWSASKRNNGTGELSMVVEEREPECLSPKRYD